MNTLDPQTIKKDFPFFADAGLLAAQDTAQAGRDVAYLDSAASSQTPQVVLDAMNAYYTKFRANVHRGLYDASEEASIAYEDARKKVAQFIGAEAHEIIFTAGATASSNMLIAMLEHSNFQGLPLESGDEVVTTVMEHHASLIPLQEFARRKELALKTISIQGLPLDYSMAEELITQKTKIVSVMLASNVTGVVNDVARIAEMAHKVGALVVCDATAAVGHMPVDVKTLGVDFLYFSGHKMCGPTGIGVLWGRQKLLETLEPGVYGGGIVDEVTLEKATWRGVPERFEAGTPNIAGAIGLGTAVEYLQSIGLENIRAHNMMLTKEAIKRLEEIPGVRVVSEKDVAKNVGIISFTIKGIHPHDVAEVLGREGVAVRAGHHCAMPLHAVLGLTATTRASFYLYNTYDDVEALVRGIKKVKEVFGK